MQGINFSEPRSFPKLPPGDAAKGEAPALVEPGLRLCRHFMSEGDDLHAENHISTFAAVACLGRHCAMQKTRIEKKAPRGD